MNDTNSESALESVGRISKIVIIAAAAVLVGFILVRACFSFGRSLFYTNPAEAAPGTDKEIVVTEDDTLDTLAERLKDEGIITDPISFRVQGLLYEIDLYPGTYNFNTSMTVKDMILSMEEQTKSLEENAALLEPNTAGLDSDEIVGGYEGEGIDSEDTGAEGMDQGNIGQGDTGSTEGYLGEDNDGENGMGGEGTGTDTGIDTSGTDETEPEFEIIGGGDEGE